MQKISEAIDKEMYAETAKQKLNLFEKISDKIKKDGRAKLKIVGGKD